MLTTLVDSLRALLFYVGYTLITVVWGTLSMLIAWAIPYRARFHFIIGAWTRMVLGWLRISCGVSHQVEGLEHIPERACVVFVKHESTWETAFIQRLFAPQATLIKRELLRIPFFGWAFGLLKPIAIDRGDARAALRHLIRAGKDRIDQNIWVVLFPEGTRVPVGTSRPFQVGGAALAQASGAPVLVVAHNGADHWPAHALRKRPGVIRVMISPPIATEGRKAKEINALAEAWLADAMLQLGRDQTSRLTTDNALASMN